MSTFVENENLSWELEDGVLLISGRGKIPDFYVGKNPAAPWDDIADEIVELEIENGVTEIGIAAFSKCRNLNVIVLPQSLSRIHYGAFEGCSALEDVVYDPDMSFVHMYEKTEKSLRRSRSIREKEKVQQIISFGLRSFTGTPWAMEMWGDYYISAGVLIDCFKENSIVSIPERVEEIGTMAFQNMNIHSVLMGEGVKVIDRFAFRNTRISSIVLPETIREVGYGAFAETPMEKAIFRGYNHAEVDPCAFMNTSIELDVNDMHVYEIAESSFPVAGVSKLGVREKTVKVTDVKDGRKVLYDESGKKVQKKEGFAGFESAEVAAPVIKHLQNGHAVIGIIMDDENHTITGAETLAWNKKDKKPVYAKLSIVDILMNKDNETPDNDKGATRLTKDEVAEMFPSANAKGMMAATSISPVKNRSHEEWYVTNDRKHIFGGVEYQIIEAWLKLYPDYSMKLG